MAHMTQTLSTSSKLLNLFGSYDSNMALLHLYANIAIQQTAVSFNNSFLLIAILNADLRDKL